MSYGVASMHTGPTSRSHIVVLSRGDTERKWFEKGFRGY